MVYKPIGKRRILLLLLVLTAFVWWMMRRRQRRQSAINQQLSVNIEELHKKYDELSVRYDKALWTSSERYLIKLMRWGLR